MRITSVEPIPVCVPLKKGLTTKTAHGEHVVSSYVLVRVHTDEGLVGLGEATVAPRWTGETSQSCVAAVEEGRAVALAEQVLACGVRCLKVKVGLDPDGDVARVEAVRRLAGAGIPLGVDANCGWDLTTARRT